MKAHSTDQLLTLGMALITDKRAMERRVRGVFARKRSAKGALALSAVLALALGFAAFTTACQPGKSAQSLTPIPLEQTMQGNSAPENTADMPESGAAEMHWKSWEYLIGSMVQSPFRYPISPGHIDELKTDYGNGVSLIVNADVKIPQTAGYGVRECTVDGFTPDKYQTLINYFLPNAKRIQNETTESQSDGTYDLSSMDFSSRITLSAEQDGKLFSVSMGDDRHMFYFERTGGIVYREGYLVGDEEMQREYKATIQEPITLTLEAAQAQANQVLADLGIRDWQLDKAERACMFENGNTKNVISRGWDFGYVLSNAGLRVHGNSSWIGMKRDSLDYCAVDAGSLWIYVDDQGVTCFYWINRYQPRAAMYSNVDIIGVDAVLTLAKARLARIFASEDTGVSKIELFEIQLSSLLISNPDDLDSGVYFDDAQRDMVLLIPTWDVSCCITHVDGSIEYITMPFCAIDGGAVSMMGS